MTFNEMEQAFKKMARTMEFLVEQAADQSARIDKLLVETAQDAENIRALARVAEIHRRN
jgi:hypothetical protein